MFDSLDALPAACDALFASGAAEGVFNSREWYRTVVRHALPQGARPRFLLASLADLPVALLPLQLLPDGHAQSLTTFYTCHYQPLLDASLDPPTLRRIFAGFARVCRRWSTLRLDAMPADWTALGDCLVGTRAGGMIACRFDHFGNWHEAVQGLSWQQYLAARPGQLRETIRRRLARSARDPAASFEIITAPEQLSAGIEAFETVYAKSWKEPEPFPRFNATLMHTTAALGLLRLGIYRVAGQPVGAQFWIVEHGHATVLKLAHDEAFKSRSPGTVLTALMLRHLLDQEQVREIDFGRGDDAYKRDWAAERRQYIGLILANPLRPAGLGFLATHAVGRMRRRLLH
jgi:hypothetical protein